MSDGIRMNGTDSLVDLRDGNGQEADLAGALPYSAKPALGSPILGELLTWLPRLGSILWLERQGAMEGRSQRDPGGSAVLLDHPAIGLLSTNHGLIAHQAVTEQGPREWLSFQTPTGAINAKLFLLPDSDVLAWDEMCAAMKLVPGESSRHEPPTHAAFLRRALDRLGHRWHARLLEFRFVQRPWLSVLDAQPPLRISLLGIDIARRIVHDENAEWLSPLHVLR